MLIRSLSCASLIALVGCMNQVGPVSGPTLAGGASAEPVIVGSVDWVEATQLTAGSPERQNANAVAYLSLPAAGSRCTGFLIAPDVIMTNEHCVPGAWAAQNVTAIFGREAGNPSSSWASWDCSTFLGNDATLDYALLQCAGRPGDVHGVVELDASPAVQGEGLYVIHQNCDYYSSPGCEPSKKYSAGKVTRVDREVRHDADTLGGSSGSPVFRGGNHKVFALHHVGLGNNGDGRGVGNYAVPMSRILPDIAARFPSLALGGAPTVVEADALEPNDAPAEASVAALPFARELTIHEGDEDLLRVELDAPGSLLVEMHLLSARGDLDLTLSRPGEAVPLARAATTADLEQLSVDLEAGAYLIRVFGHEGARNTYTLAARLLDPDAPPAPPSGEAFEPNEAPAAAAPLPIPFAWDGLSISSATDNDFFRLTGAGRVTVEALFSHAAGDLDLQVIDENGAQLASGVSADDNERIELDLGAGRTVYLRVLGYQGATAPYDLRVTAN